MKKLLLTISVFYIAACASLSPSTGDLKSANECTVWKEGLMGTKHVVTVKEEMAKQKMTCFLMNTYLCTYTDYTFRPNTNEILSSLPPADKTIAKLEGRKLVVDMKGITVEPFELGPDHASYHLQGPIGPKTTHTVEYNSKCSLRQASLGLLTIIAK